MAIKKYTPPKTNYPQQPLDPSLQQPFPQYGLNFPMDQPGLATQLDPGNSGSPLQGQPQSKWQQILGNPQLMNLLGLAASGAIGGGFAGQGFMQAQEGQRQAQLQEEQVRERRQRLGMEEQQLQLHAQQVRQSLISGLVDQAGKFGLDDATDLGNAYGFKPEIIRQANKALKQAKAKELPVQVSGEESGKIGYPTAQQIGMPQSQAPTTPAPSQGQVEGGFESGNLPMSPLNVPSVQAASGGQLPDITMLPPEQALAQQRLYQQQRQVTEEKQAQRDLRIKEDAWKRFTELRTRNQVVPKELSNQLGMGNQDIQPDKYGEIDLNAPGVPPVIRGLLKPNADEQGRVLMTPQVVAILTPYLHGEFSKPPAIPRDDLKFGQGGEAYTRDAKTGQWQRATTLNSAKGPRISDPNAFNTWLKTRGVDVGQLKSDEYQKGLEMFESGTPPSVDPGVGGFRAWIGLGGGKLNIPQTGKGPVLAPGTPTEKKLPDGRIIEWDARDSQYHDRGKTWRR